jgi:16S rRNA (guanine527-N7)-methyltransferase
LPETIGEIFSASGLSLREGAGARFSQYLSLLERWNQKFNLTAIQEPDQIIRRHFVEGAFAAAHIPADVKTLLDFGSGAGIPGIPIAICRPEIRVTLAEGQSKKAVFLREVVRTLELRSEVYAGRVEAMPEGNRFDAVTMRAVEKMEVAIPHAARLTEKYLVLLATGNQIHSFQSAAAGFIWQLPIALPASESAILTIGHRERPFHVEHGS